MRRCAVCRRVLFYDPRVNRECCPESATHEGEGSTLR
jgi:hypothetical protein